MNRERDRRSRKRMRIDERVERSLERADRARSRRRGRRRRRPRSETSDMELSDEERAHRRLMRRARSRANKKIAFLTHLGSYLATLALLLITTRSLRVVGIVGIGWGIGVFIHHLWAIAAPRLRDHWLEEEIGTRSARGVESERRQVETRSRRSLEDLSASIAHEIRNPITAAKSLVQQMGEDPASNENLEYAGLALSELDRVERSISHLLRYARDEEPRFEEVDLKALARAATEGLRERADAAGIELVTDLDGMGAMRGDPEKLRRVVENLVSNAIDALTMEMPANPRIEVAAGENLAGSELWLRVRDNGAGIPEEERERIWSPFYTTKETGTGLGLALSQKTVEAHGGRIDLGSGATHGSEFVLSFPIDPAGSQRPAREGVR